MYFGRFIVLKFDICVETNEQVAFRKKIKSNRSSNLNWFISSVYHPNNIENQEILNEYLSSIYSQVQSKYFLQSDQDMNANLSVRSNKTWHYLTLWIIQKKSKRRRSY